MTKIALLSFVILVAGCASQEERLWQQDAGMTAPARRASLTEQRAIGNAGASSTKCTPSSNMRQAPLTWSCGAFPPLQVQWGVCGKHDPINPRRLLLFKRPNIMRGAVLSSASPNLVDVRYRW